MREPETEVFYAELVDDELGQGIRLYDATDTVYELREDSVETRIYHDDGVWRVKTRTPVKGGDEEAYEAFRDAAHGIGEAYNWDVTVPAYDFMNGDHRLALDPDELSGELRYNEDDGVNINIDVDLKRRHSIHASLKSLATIDGAAAGIGAVLGGGFGAVAGIPVEGAMAASALGGAVGTGLWSLDTWCTYIKDDSTAPTYKQREQLRKKTGKKRAERARDGDHLLDGTLLDRVNERNRLATEIEEVEDYGKAERYQELTEDTALQLFDAAVRIHFDKFHRWDGVIADGEMETYEDAYRFAASIAGTPVRNQERPSIYTNPDAFRSVFRALPDGDRDALVENVLNHRAADDIIDFLDRKHPERVQDIGGETRLHAAPDPETGGDTR